jgi:hypothetical protein
MKHLPTYEQFMGENYLPYFGVKQALDDSHTPMLDEKMSDFHRIYAMSPTWWTAWRKENSDKYEFKQDAFSKTYEVSKDKKVVFVFDYGRNKIFTNETPDLFTIKTSISPEEFEKIKDIDVENPSAKPEDEESKGKEKKEDEKEEDKKDEFSI